MYNNELQGVEVYEYIYSLILKTVDRSDHSYSLCSDR